MKFNLKYETNSKKKVRSFEMVPINTNFYIELIKNSNRYNVLDLVSSNLISIIVRIQTSSM